MAVIQPHPIVVLWSFMSGFGIKGRDWGGELLLSASTTQKQVCDPSWHRINSFVMDLVVIALLEICHLKKEIWGGIKNLESPLEYGCVDTSTHAHTHTHIRARTFCFVL